MTGVALSPTVKPSAEVAGVPTFMLLLTMVVIVGGEITVSVKRIDVDKPPPSLTVSVMVVWPLTPAIGVIFTVRAAPEPARAILASGTSVLLLEVDFNISEPTGVESSPIVNASAEVATVPSVMLLSPIVEMVGAPFTVKIKKDVAVNPAPSATVSKMTA